MTIAEHIDGGIYIADNLKIEHPDADKIGSIVKCPFEPGIVLNQIARIETAGINPTISTVLTLTRTFYAPCQIYSASNWYPKANSESGVAIFSVILLFYLSIISYL